MSVYATKEFARFARKAGETRLEAARAAGELIEVKSDGDDKEKD